MKFLNVAIVLLYSVCAVSAGRRYIAIPIDGVDVIELNPIGPAPARVGRQTEAYVPSLPPVGSVPAVVHQDAFDAPRQERSAGHILDYVDFGARTGANGAFGWYADYPTHH